MIVTTDQLTELDRIKREEFIYRVIAHIRSELGDELTDSDEMLYARFEKWFFDAKKYNITKEADVQLYIEICMVSDDLASDEKPRWMMMVLSKNSINGQKKMERIYNKILEDAGI